MTTPVPKRSLFSKPSWAASTAAPVTKTDDDVTFGRHSQIYDDIVAENRKKKGKRAAKAKAKVEEPEAPQYREPKRRRISEEHESSSDSGSAYGKSEDDRNDLKRGVARARPVTRSTPSKKKLEVTLDSSAKAAVSKSKPAEATSILLDDDNDLQITAATAATVPPEKSKSKKAVVDDFGSDPESDDDDDYIRDLKRRTKGTTIISKQANVARKRTAPPDPTASMAESLEISQHSPSLAEDDLQQDEGPLVKILITSIYPNTKNLVVGQPASRSLKRAKEIWCQKQGFDEARTRSFFFTFNGAKLFDSSNLLNTLEVLKRQRPHEDDPSDGKIHLEAMNAEIMEHRKKQKERAEAEAAKPEEQGGENQPAQENETRPLEKKFVITLQGEKMEPFRLSVRPSTSIVKIMVAFQHNMGVQEGKVCWMVFDGNRLDPKSTIQDAEIEEDDVVEVHIR